MVKTAHKFDWEKGFCTIKTLSRSFDTKEEAMRFAEGKSVVDIYRLNGRYKVEWKKETDDN